MIAKNQWTKIEILLITALMAFCSIIYELLLANTLAIVTGDQVWWQSLTIGIYIGGLGLGAYLSDRLVNVYKSIINTEIALSILGMVCVVLVYIFHGSYKYIDQLFFYSSDFHSVVYLQNQFILKVIFFVLVQFLTLTIGALSGFEIPLVIRLAKEKLNGDYDYQIFGINYIGTLIGTTCFAYFLLPKMDVVKTSVIVAFLNLMICLYFSFRYLKVDLKKFYIPASFGIMLLGIFILSSERLITQTYLKLFYYVPRILSENKQDADFIIKKINSMPDIERSKSLYQYLDIFKYPMTRDHNRIDATILTLDTNFQFNSVTEYLYHEAFAHVSMAINEKVPRKVLVLGGGDGLLIRELLKYKEIETIDFIELDEKMIHLAKERFKELNKDSLSDPRVRIQINDGFYFLRNTSEKFDAIFIDFPYPNSYDLSRLYSVEFYTYVRRALNPNGFAILDVPFYDQETNMKGAARGRVTLTTIFNEMHVKSNSVVASTFYYAGFKTIFPYRIGDESFLFLKAEPGAISYDFDKRANLSLLSKETIEEMEKVKNQSFPYEIATKYVNSIFRPQIIRKNNF